MSGGSYWNLPPWRRGFYGTSNPLKALAYSDLAPGRGKAPWFVAFRIADKARDEHSVAPGYFASLKDPSFRRWLEQNAARFGFSSATALIRELESSGDILDDGRMVGFLRTYEGVLEPSKNQAIVGRILDEFLDYEHIKTVEDTQEDNSWYVRKREAIDQIVGTPSDLLTLMKSAEFWKSEAGEQGLASGVLIAAQVLAELPSVDESDLEALKSALNEAMPKEPFGFDYIIIGHYAALIAIVDVFSKLREQGRTDAFRESVSQFIGAIDGQIRKMTSADFFDPLLSMLRSTQAVAANNLV
jgi:hypothetical protein